MSCEKYQHLMMGYLDQELDKAETKEFLAHIAECRSCRMEMDRFEELKKVTDMAKIKTPEDIFWDGYWAGIYNRLERSVAWVMVSAGGIILVLGLLIWILQTCCLEHSQPIWVRIGVPLVIGGLIVMLISAFRERLRASKNERYKDVRR